jgi:sec-independent protein translocase protein TatB
MFDINFSELVVIGTVALVVLGPERLPKVARTAGHLFGRLQRYVAGVKADIAREMEFDELRKFKSEMENSARSFESVIQRDLSLAEQEIGALKREASMTNNLVTRESSQTDEANLSGSLVGPTSEHDSDRSPQMELPFDTDLTQKPSNR